MQPMPPGGPPPGYPPPGYGYPPPGYGYPPPQPSTRWWLWILLAVLGGVFVLGILAAIAIPSFLAYQKKAKYREVDTQLLRLRQGAQRSYSERAGFPQQTVGLTPSVPCCESSHGRCRPDPALWIDEPWSTLGFEIDVPSYFRYSYTGSADGQSMVVTAVTDLDCDGEELRYTLTGTVVGGAPRFEIQQTGRD
jgi:type II secretory pathway pseudopilin PulG